jgi:hypothetical protein
MVVEKKPVEPVKSVERQLVLPLEFRLEPSAREADGRKAEDTFQLLDEAHGKIRHVVLSYGDDRLAKFITNLIPAMDDDVVFTAFRRPNSNATIIDSFLHEQGSRVRVFEAAGVVEYPQDRIHVLHSREYGLYALVPEKGVEALYNAVQEHSREFVRIQGRDLRWSLKCFEGGDIMPDDKRVFVGPELIAQNKSPERVRERISRISGNRGVVLVTLGNVVEHLDMFFKPVGDDTVVVGDTRLAREKLTDADRVKLARLLEGTAFHDRELDVLAERMEGEGLKVERIPVLFHPRSMMHPARTYGYSNVSYTNVELENYSVGGDNVRRVYMPAYGISLDETAKDVWEKKLGFKVVPINVGTDSFTLGDSFRCNMKVVERRYF